MSSFLPSNLVRSLVLPVSKPASQVPYIWLEDWVLILKVREKVRAPNSTDDFWWNMKLEPSLFCCCFSLVLFQDKILLSYFFKLKLKYFIAAFCKVKYLLLGVMHTKELDMLIIQVEMELNLHKTHCHFLVAQLQDLEPNVSRKH